MASSSTSSSFPSSSFHFKHEVFLSFRGEDTRDTFTDHLYTAFVRRGIVTFRDEEKIRKGKQVSSELWKAIEESRFSVIILSESYTNSKWCLDELTKIIECEKTKGHTALPVFYHVQPSDVRHQAGVFRDDFNKHERQHKEKVKRWREAMTQVGKYKGWHLKKGSSEARLVKEIVDDIWEKLRSQTSSSVDGSHFGMDSHIRNMNAYLEAVSDWDVGIIGIYGMGGIGKTTISRVVYNMLSNQYDGHSFLADVRQVSKDQRGLVYLQKQLLSQVLMIKEKDLVIHDVYEGMDLIKRRLCSKKVIVVLDDVDRLEQLETLARQPNWFGPGSRILVTTRDERLLTSHGVKLIYRVRGLNHSESLKLFLSKAFKHAQPTNYKLQLSSLVVKYANGLPLALNVFGSLFCNLNVKEWESTLDRIQKVPDKQILQRLRISYDGLEEPDKTIFLDIACFFKGKERYKVEEILKGCNLSPDIGIRNLVDKSLITISSDSVDEVIWIHDVLQEMGWEIAREKDVKDPGKWSRLWQYNDIYRVLKENMGTREVECIILDEAEEEITDLSGKCFSSMTNMRLLKINSKIRFSEDLEYLSNQLQYLEWTQYPLCSLPSSFQPQKLFKLEMCHSSMEYLWEGKKVLKELKTIHLSHSLRFTRTPNFTGIPNLEKLDLEGCESLVVVHESLGALEKLIELNLRNCKNLKSFPKNVCGLKSLKILKIDGCSKLEKLPQNLGELKGLWKLDFNGTAVRDVPSSIAQLEKLQILSFEGCNQESPREHQSSMCLRLPALTGLSSLYELNLRNCGLSDGAIPDDIGSLFSLYELDLSGNNFVTLPAGISQLPQLRYLNLEKCKMLRLLPELPLDIARVDAQDCSSLETLSSTLNPCHVTKMDLYFDNCIKLNVNEAVKLLKRQAQFYFERDLTHQPTLLSITLPGSDVPGWFDHSSNGYEIEFQPDSNWLNDEFMGFALCAVFSTLSNEVNREFFSFGIYVGAETHFYHNDVVGRHYTAMKSDHLWLGYISDQMISDTNYMRKDRSDTIRFVIIYEEDQQLPTKKKKNQLLKSCGIHLVYKEDLQYLGVDHNEELPA